MFNILSNFRYVRGFTSGPEGNNNSLAGQFLQNNQPAANIVPVPAPEAAPELGEIPIREEESNAFPGPNDPSFIAMRNHMAQLVREDPALARFFQLEEVVPEVIPSDGILSSEERIKSQLFVMSVSSYELLNEKYKMYCNIHSRDKIPNTQLDHIKTLALRTFIISNQSYVLVTWHVWFQLYHLFIYAHKFLLDNISPVDDYYLIALESVIRKFSVIVPNQVPIEGQKVAYHMFLPKVENSAVSMIYGSANGCSDLILFCPVKYNTMEFSIDFNASADKSSTFSLVLTPFNKQEDPTLTPVSTVVKVEDLQFTGSFDYNMITDSKAFRFKSEHTMFIQSSFKDMFLELFKFEATTSELVTARADATHRESFTVRNTSKEDSSFETFAGAYSSVVQNVSNIKFHLRDSYMVYIIMSLMHADFISDFKSTAKDHDYLRYVASVLFSYYKSQIDSATKEYLTKLKCSFKLECISNKNTNINYLHKQFVDGVKRGKIFPFTPVQYAYYFNSKTITTWNKYIFFATMFVKDLFDNKSTVLPETSLHNKDAFVEIVSKPKMLTTGFYQSTMVPEFMTGLSLTLSFESFMYELAIKSLASTDLPEYIPSFTKGEWSGLNSNSIAFSTTTLNDYFVKFSYPAGFDKDDYIKSIAFKEADLPKFVTKRVKSGDNIPKIMSRFVDEL